MTSARMACRRRSGYSTNLRRHRIPICSTTCERRWANAVESLGVIISTQAANDLHPLSQMIDDAALGEDPSVYLQLAARADDADIFDEKTWFACNEALGKFLDLNEFRAQAEQAKRLPTFRAKFQNLRLNKRIDAHAQFISDADWMACAIRSTWQSSPASLLRRPRSVPDHRYDRVGSVLAAQRRRAAVFLAAGGRTARSRPQGRRPLSDLARRRFAGNDAGQGNQFQAIIQPVGRDQGAI